MKKNLAAYRYIDEKVVPMYVSETSLREIEEQVTEVTFLDLFLKRAVDVVFSLFVLVFGFPFYMLLALFIKLTSKGPVFFMQDRMGLDCKAFKLYKFRTMVPRNCDKGHRQFAENFIKGKLNGENGNSKNVFKLKDDPRVTSIGRFLRRTSLDELPQFLNVIKGEMSLVGPRPPLTYELDHYKEWHKKRLTVKPGLTGLWQVSGRSSVPFDEMVMLDLYYIENWSLVLDTKIILRTLPVMLSGYGGY